MVFSEYLYRASKRAARIKQLDDNASIQVRLKGRTQKWLYNHSVKDESIDDRIWRLINEFEELEETQRKPYQV